MSTFFLQRKIIFSIIQIECSKFLDNPEEYPVDMKY